MFLPALKDKNARDLAAKSRDLLIKARSTNDLLQANLFEAESAGVDAELMRDFLVGWKEVEAMTDKRTGKTYGELMKSGEMIGVRTLE